MNKLLVLITALFFLFFAGAMMAERSFAGEQNLLRQKSPWKQININGKEKTEFRLTREMLEIIADKSVAFFYREIRPVMSAKPRLKWQWRVIENIPATDQTIAKKDDRPVAIHLWFDDGKSSVFGSVATLLGYPRVGHLITYVWGGKRDSGTIVRNPHFPKTGVIIVLHNGYAKTGSWRSEARDIVADFRSSFGIEPKLTTLRYIAVSGDTDDSLTSSRSQLRKFRIVE